MISIDDALEIHSVLIEKFGGTKGLRERNLLESALVRPYQTFDGKELYSTAVEKAAAIIESVINNHPFLDGNKRFGYVAMRLTLMAFGHDIKSSENEKYEFVLSIAKGDFKYDEILEWLIDRVI